MDKQLAKKISKFLKLCDDNDYSPETNLIYEQLGKELNAASSEDIFQNSRYSEEVAYLRNMGKILPIGKRHFSSMDGAS
jgi:hypothetical protein